ncbi:MAG: 2Fe-2S iron-sulfur cluster-binding protein, partial [Candidatus Competibacteraceae bacterium]|nr:2Fe-2S iron-sulfur cluster-binding protein [Candidatus Competibacteraceae bacterium]
FNGTGHITADVLRQVLPLDDYDFYLCGPPPFMQALYDILRGLGVRDARIFTEAFGPVSLARRPDEGSAPVKPVDEADQAMIKFAKSGFEQSWNSGDAAILETAEAHGLAPEFGCRNGICGTCAVKLKSGSVTYRTQPTAVRAADEALICCAVPAKGTDTVEIDL